jgi:nitrilase
MPTKVAVIQTPPVLLDRDQTIAQAVASINEAAGAGARKKNGVRDELNSK